MRKASLASKVPFFARILAPCRTRNHPIPPIHRTTLHSAAVLCMVGLVDLRAQHNANIQAKSPTCQK
jgi:hypothetical protein